MTHEEMVREFMVKHDLGNSGYPDTGISEEVKILRIRLIAEEFAELLIAIQKKDIIEIADALADLDYVVTGTAIAYGIPHEAVFQEVHRSNMTKPKLDTYGKGGKEGYTPADIKGILSAFRHLG